VFWKAESNPEVSQSGRNPGLNSLPYLILPVLILAAITVIMGLFSEPFFTLATHAAEQLLNPTDYIEAVGPM
jgi:multicomponent Na+:H+ antiporter subunit D